jgi:hypothetical protein
MLNKLIYKKKNRRNSNEDVIACPKCHEDPQKRDYCNGCLGRGTIDSHLRNCFICNGLGIIYNVSMDMKSPNSKILNKKEFKERIERKTCLACRGLGHVESYVKKCELCEKNLDKSCICQGFKFYLDFRNENKHKF